MPARRRASPLMLLALVAGCAIRPPLATEPSETTPRPAAAATVAPTADPTPTAIPSPTPDPTLLQLEATSCPGGVVLDWSPSAHPAFHHYIALRSPQREIARNYPPLAPAVDWGDTFTTDRFVTAAVDASIVPSERQWHYRVIAYDARGRAVAASRVERAELRTPLDLGALEAEVEPDGSVTLAWRPYEGVTRCFTAYRVLAGSGGGPLGTLTVVSDQASGSLETDALHAGATYELRVQAVRTTTLGSFVLGQTHQLTLTLP